MTIRRFEDIEAWKTARVVARLVEDACKRQGFDRDFSLKDQIRRAAASVTSNIAEGFTRRSDKEFVHFLFIAKSSAAEVESCLYTALDRGHLDQTLFQKIYIEANRCERQMSGLISFLLGRKSSSRIETR